jgi:hypothetical protein
MKTLKSLCCTASIMVLTVTLLSHFSSGSNTKVLARSVIPFTEHTIDANFDGANTVYAADVDGDSDIDVLGAASDLIMGGSDWYGEIAWWENDGTPADGGWTKHTIASNFGGAFGVFGMDMDGDTDIDVLGAAYFGDAIAWWENDGTPADGGWTEHIIATGFDGADDVYAMDMDGDTDIDVLGAAHFGDAIAWWENDGTPADGGWTEHIIATGFDGAASVHAIDLNGDTHVDVVGAASGSLPEYNGTIAWWENDGTPADGGWAKHTLFDDFANATDAYASDLDGDDDPDIVAVGLGEPGFTWWENRGGGSFTVHSIPDGFERGVSVLAVALDSDEDVDVVASSGSDGIAWWENDGSQGFTQHTIDITTDMLIRVHDTDLDGDTDVDILGAAYAGGSITWWEQSPPVYQVFLPAQLKNVGPPPQPVLDPIANPDGDGNYSVSWGAVSRATVYTLEEDDNVAFSSPQTSYSGPATSLAISGKDVGTYFYRVRASNSFGSSDWSNIQSVDVTVEPTGPEPGHFTGTDPTVSFDVTTDQEVCDFTITVPFDDGTCRYRVTTCLPIIDDEFIFAVLDPWANQYENRFEGRFDTRTHAVGTYSVHFCQTTLIFDPSQGTWEASK